MRMVIEDLVTFSRWLVFLGGVPSGKEDGQGVRRRLNTDVASLTPHPPPDPYVFGLSDLCMGFGFVALHQHLATVTGV